MCYDIVQSNSFCELLLLAQAVARRAALGLLAGAAALITNAQPSEAAFGEAARVFGSKPTNTSGEPCPLSQQRLLLSFVLLDKLACGTEPLALFCLRLHPVLGRGIRAAAARALEPQQGEGLCWRAAAVRSTATEPFKRVAAL